ncbi:S-layer homology domain-containing protein [Acetonema longum]|uniref:S-layer domain protein n=1 Tax=Acetonema longum DSM 6540 TaxID=1009370 RepID=F7NN57_9FIRM|nr:S-layer homology domain-containing protein [Acetonema longum]EGO62523.1 S-layer domain protein [Acetonema longum DSM 6540]
MVTHKLKQKLLTLAVVSLVGFAGIASAAAPNPFGDVPARHWTYEAVNKLIREGVIDGEGTGSFTDSRLVTRYEMAQMVARALWNKEKASGADQELIDKLAAEFANELNTLGVHTDAAEKKREKITVWGFLHLSGQGWDNSGDFQNSTAATGDTPHANDGFYPAIGIDLFISYRVSDAWQIIIEDEAVRDLRSGGYWSPEAEGIVGASQRAGQMYADGTMGATAVKAGRFDYGAAYGLMVAAGRKGINGVQLASGDKYKKTFTYGYFRRGWTGNATNPKLISSQTDNRYAAFGYDAPLAPDANFKAAYHNITNDGSDADVFADHIRLWEVGADKMIGKDLQLFATYGQSNAGTQNKAYIAGVNYKRADLSVPGSYGLTARYIRAEAQSSIAPDNYWVSKYDWGLQGPELSGLLMFDKNFGMTFWLVSLKATDGVHSGKLKTVKAELDYFF